MAELFTLEDLAALRGADEISPADDGALRGTVTGLVRGFCGWHVGTEQDDELTVVVRNWQILLPTMWIVAKPVVTLADATGPTDFSWWPNGLIQRRAGWGSVDDEITVALTHGYPSGSWQHEAVKSVALSVAQRLLDPNNKDGKVLTEDERYALNPYRLQSA